MSPMVGRQRKIFRLEALRQSFECIKIQIQTVRKLLHNVVYFDKLLVGILSPENATTMKLVSASHFTHSRVKKIRIVKLRQKEGSFMFCTVSVLFQSQLKLPSLIFTLRFKFTGDDTVHKSLQRETDSSVGEKTCRVS